MAKMANREELRHRLPHQNSADRATSPPSHKKVTAREHGTSTQILRGILLFTWMNTCCVVSHLTQWVGVWLYLVDRDRYYAWMAGTKAAFGLLITTITQWFAPMTVRISGSKECMAQIKVGPDGRLNTAAFPDRMVLIANHQLYSDWLFLWWIAYTGQRHGHIYIILKESLKWIPVVGIGMQFYGFIFMARNWAKDQARLQYRLRKLNSRRGESVFGKDGKGSLNPMWLLIFPEGTNLSANTRRKSKAFAEKTGIDDFKHVLLPRSTGLLCCLQELKSTVEWVYDCTVAYEGIPPGEYGQDVYTNRGIYFGGKAPRSVNMHWRRFHVSTIPLSSPSDFEKWVMDRWVEKDALMEYYTQTGHFPADTDTPASTPASSTILSKSEDGKIPAPDNNAGHIEVEVKVKGIWELFTTIFAPLTKVISVLLLINVLVKSLFG